MFSSSYLRTEAQVTEPPLPDMLSSSEGIVWKVPSVYSGSRLTVSGPGTMYLQQDFPATDAPIFSVKDDQGIARPDGGYIYELRLYPLISEEVLAILEETPEEEREEVVAALRQSGALPEGLILSGAFSIQGGSLVIADEGSAGTGDDEAPITLMDLVQEDDVIITGGLCVGRDCVDGEVFEYDSIRLKQPKVRIHFEDNSDGSNGYPTTDWRIVINDANNGGAEYFAVENSDTLQQIFRLAAGAPANTLYADDSGNVGFGTATPLEKVHVVDGSTPTIRLDQDESDGWAAQIWDIAANNGSFFIRDVTNSNRIPFRIFTGAPASSITVRADGRVGLGTGSPAAQLHIEGISGITPMQVRNGSDVVIFKLDESGNLVLNGALTEASDVHLKENFAPVDGEAILAQIATLSVSTWNYINDPDSVRHVGPMAQDFYATFGLGSDDTHIAPLDVNGVTLAGMQALIEKSEQQDMRIQQLEQENTALEQRLDTLEAQLNALLATQED